MVSAACRTGYTRESTSLNTKATVSGLRKACKVQAQLYTLMATFLTCSKVNVFTVPVILYYQRYLFKKSV